jgi:hypothetical protein
MLVAPPPIQLKGLLFNPFLSILYPMSFAEHFFSCLLSFSITTHSGQRTLFCSELEFLKILWGLGTE